MSANIVIVHGAYGHPQENWFEWLRQKLQDNHIPALVPALPTPDGQSLSHWMRAFNELCQPHINDQTVLIGHSLGAAFILRWLERHAKKVKAVLLAGVFTGSVGDKKFDDINRDFFMEPFNWECIRASGSYFECYHGDNDPYVDQDNFHFIADKLHARKILVAQGGHLNAAAGYTEFPLLYTNLMNLIR